MRRHLLRDPFNALLIYLFAALSWRTTATSDGDAGSSSNSNGQCVEQDQCSVDLSTPLDQMLNTPGEPYPLADNRGRIVCHGRIPPWLELPPGFSHLDWDNSQQLCSHNNYGGSAYANLGGYCQGEGDSRGITFGASDSRHPEFYASLVLKSWCFVHCDCANDPRQITTTVSAGVEYLIIPEVDGILLNTANSALVVVVFDHSTLIGTETLYQPPTALNEPPQITPGPRNGIGRNRGRTPFIICAGLLPWWELPSPVHVGMYDSLQRLCASKPNGGLRDSNMGGRCDSRYTPAQVVFDPYWALESLWEDYRLHAYCGAKCWCVDSPMPRYSNGELIHLGENIMVNTENWGLVLYSMDETRGMSSLTLVPPQDSNPYLAQPEPELAAVQGAQPQPGQGVTEPFLAAPTPVVIVTNRHGERYDNLGEASPGSSCGGLCSSPGDCLMTASCLCVLSLWTLGTDPVARGSRCRARGSKSWPGWPRKERSASTDLCVCNATYASEACCGSLNGIIWEEAGNNVLGGAGSYRFIGGPLRQ